MALSRRHADALDDSITPMLALAGPLPGSDEGWAYEFKWDGVRAISVLEHGRVRATTRNRNDLMGSFPELSELAGQLGSRTVMLDGEIVAFDESGRPSFGRLQHRLHRAGSRVSGASGASGAIAVSYLLFDLLYLDGRSLLAATYDERRGLLDSLGLAGALFATPRSFLDEHGADVLEAAREGQLEGVVAKRRSSPYRPGVRTNDWIKIKNFRTQEAVIGGWTDGKGARADELGALLLGIPGEGGLEYVGKVGTGFDQPTRRELLSRLAPIANDESPFSAPLSPAETALAHFVRPVLVGEVRYGERTTKGHLRHPIWRGLRPDKRPDEVTHEP